MDYSLLVGIDEERQELVVGIVGKERRRGSPYTLCTYTFCYCYRFHSNVYLGQEIRKLGQGIWHIRWRRKGAHHCITTPI